MSYYEENNRQGSQYSLQVSVEVVTQEGLTTLL